MYQSEGRKTKPNPQIKPQEVECQEEAHQLLGLIRTTLLDEARCPSVCGAVIPLLFPTPPPCLPLLLSGGRADEVVRPERLLPGAQVVQMLSLEVSFLSPVCKQPIVRTETRYCFFHVCAKMGARQFPPKLAHQWQFHWRSVQPRVFCLLVTASKLQLGNSLLASISRHRTFYIHYACPVRQGLYLGRGWC